MPSTTYIGRFAPSPTGLLHFGSLVAALASFLDARAQQGKWLVRIEDVDTTRCQAEHIPTILHTLERYGLHWDDEVLVQNTRFVRYQERLEQLISMDLAFACSCSRKQLDGAHHHGRCYNTQPTDFAWRFLCPTILNGQSSYCFEDRIQGRWCEHLINSLDDFVLKRRDGLWAYQLAVVSDDIDQGVTHIVRGIDLIDSTARQALLYHAFGQPLPSYAHLPIAVNAAGQKLSKQNLAEPLTMQVAATLFAALVWLKQSPPPELYGSRDELLAWAIAHWDMQPLATLKTLAVGEIKP